MLDKFDLRVYNLIIIFFFKKSVIGLPQRGFFACPDHINRKIYGTCVIF
jgi:hypothetical protein